MLDRASSGERSLLVHIGHGRACYEDETQEFEALADSAGADVVGELHAQRARPDARYFLGTGKVDELAELVAESQAELVLVACPAAICLHVVITYYAATQLHLTEVIENATTCWGCVVLDSTTTDRHLAITDLAPVEDAAPTSSAAILGNLAQSGDIERTVVVVYPASPFHRKWIGGLVVDDPDSMQIDNTTHIHDATAAIGVDLPTLPEVALRIRDTAEDPDVSASSLARVIA